MRRYAAGVGSTTVQVTQPCARAPGLLAVVCRQVHPFPRRQAGGPCGVRGTFSARLRFDNGGGWPEGARVATEAAVEDGTQGVIRYEIFDLVGRPSIGSSVRGSSVARGGAMTRWR